MAVRGITSILLLCALAGSTVGALAETAKGKDAGTAGYTLYDQTIDPTTAAIRAVLSTAGQKGSFLDKRDGAAVAEYYAEQGYVPSWTADGRLTDRARAIIKRISEADADGLDHTDFSLPATDLGQYARPSGWALAQADVMMSQAILAYAREAYAGRVDPASLGPNVGYERHLPDPIEVLSTVASAADSAKALGDYNPQLPQFAKLRAMLAELRAKAKT
jgi:L,D-transpeptidase YcbB